VLVLLAGPALLRVFRRGARRAAFGVPVVFEPAVATEAPRVHETEQAR
jgi:energy-coupling factor transport system substrate-specific component